MALTDVGMCKTSMFFPILIHQAVQVANIAYAMYEKKWIIG